MELISRSESGLEPNWQGGSNGIALAAASGSGSGFDAASASTTSKSRPGELRDRSISGSSTGGGTRTVDLTGPPSTPPRAVLQLQNEDGFLGVGPKWGGGGDTESKNSSRASRMIGRSPPPPPGPPPSDPPPLPPASSHPFASSSSSASSSSRPRPSARLSSLSSLRKANMIPSRPSSPAGPPPTGDLPPLPSAPASINSHESGSTANGSGTSGRPGHSRKTSDNLNPPQVSPRSSSLFSTQQSQAGPSGTASLGTPITLDKNQAQPPAPIISAHSPASAAVQSSSSSSRPSSKPPRTPSRHLLQTALDLAQKAVEMDKNNDVLGALAAYREAVSRLKAVMERVGVEPSGERRRRSGVAKSEEEGRTLRGIHDAYVARIQLLSSYETNPEPTGHAFPGPSSSTPPATSSTSHQRNPSQPSSTLVPLTQTYTADEGTPRPSLDDGAMTGIGNFMLADSGDQSSDMSALNSPSKTYNASQPIRRRSDTQPVPQAQVEQSSSPPPVAMPISERVGQTESSSPTLPSISGSSNEVSLQQALDEAAEASASGSIAHSPIVPIARSSAGIGLGYPISPPNMVQAASAIVPTHAFTPSPDPNTNSTPTKVNVASRSVSAEDDDNGSPSPSKLRLKRSARPSLGLDMETDLTGIDGVDEDMEVLARTPRDSHMPASLEHRGTDVERRSSGQRVPPSPQSVKSIERLLPPLPDSAPIMDAAGRPIVTSRTASLSGASIPVRPPSGTFLVSPTTAQGTISQRRQSRPLSGSVSAALEQMQLQAQLQPQQQASSQTQGQDRAGDVFFPASSSASSIRSTSASSTGARVRAKSQPGHRPSVHSSSELPPIPPSQIRHKASFSSSSQLGTGLIPQVQRAYPHSATASASGGSSTGPLRIDTDHHLHQHQRQGQGGLAPPVNITSRSGSPRSLPPLPDTAYSTASAISGGGSLISPLPEAQPMEVIHRPFHLLRIIHASMDPECPGSYLTGAIHISSAVWNPSNWSRLPSYAAPGSIAGSNNGGGSGGGGGGGGKLIAPPKIVAQDTKVRCIEALILHFESIRITGQALLVGPRDRGRSRSTSGNDGELNKIAEELCIALDELDEEMDNTHKLLVKQGVGVGSWKGKKTGGTSKSWGSRISRSMDKMTNSKTDRDRLDSTDKYVDLLAHLCGGAQVINDHLSNFTGNCTPAYSSLSEKAYRNIESRLRRTAEFVGTVVVPFVVDDFKQFFLRYLKGGVRYLED